MDIQKNRDASSVPFTAARRELDEAPLAGSEDPRANDAEHVVAPLDREGHRRAGARPLEPTAAPSGAAPGTFRWWEVPKGETGAGSGARDADDGEWPVADAGSFDPAVYREQQGASPESKIATRRRTRTFAGATDSNAPRIRDNVPEGSLISGRDVGAPRSIHAPREEADPGEASRTVRSRLDAVLASSLEEKPREPQTSEHRASEHGRREAHASNPRSFEPRGFEPQGFEPRGFEPRGFEPRDDFRPRGFELRGVEPQKPKPLEPEEQRPEARTSEPRTSEPRTSGPRTSEPRTSEPRTSEPRTSEPRTSEPRTSEPRTSEPRTSEPRTSEPRTSEPRTSEPRIEAQGHDAQWRSPGLDAIRMPAGSFRARTAIEVMLDGNDQTLVTSDARFFRPLPNGQSQEISPKKAFELLTRSLTAARGEPETRGSILGNKRDRSRERSMNQIQNAQGWQAIDLSSMTPTKDTYLAIGPSGVVTVSYRRRPGRMPAVGPNQVRGRKGELLPYLDEARTSADTVHRVLRDIAGVDLPAQPLLAFRGRGSFIASVHGLPRDVVVLDDDKLTEHLIRQRGDLSPEDVRRIRALAAHQVTWDYFQEALAG